MRTIFSVIFALCGSFTGILLFGVGLAYGDCTAQKNTNVTVTTVTVVSLLLFIATGIFFYAAGYVAQ